VSVALRDSIEPLTSPRFAQFPQEKRGDEEFQQLSSPQLPQRT
jgi:hypothetical protein